MTACGHNILAACNGCRRAPDDEDLEPDVGADAEAELALRRDLIALQRRTLLGLRSEGRIGVSTLRTIEHTLDLEEARLASA